MAWFWHIHCLVTNKTQRSNHDKGKQPYSQPLRLFFFITQSCFSCSFDFCYLFLRKKSGNSNDLKKKRGVPNPRCYNAFQYWQWPLCGETERKWFRDNPVQLFTLLQCDLASDWLLYDNEIPVKVLLPWTILCLFWR